MCGAPPPFTRPIRFSRNGPIVDEILPAGGVRDGSRFAALAGPYQLRLANVAFGNGPCAAVSLNCAKRLAGGACLPGAWLLRTVRDIFGYQAVGGIPVRRSRGAGVPARVGSCSPVAGADSV